MRITFDVTAARACTIVPFLAYIIIRASLSRRNYLDIMITFNILYYYYYYCTYQAYDISVSVWGPVLLLLLDTCIYYYNNIVIDRCATAITTRPN